MKQLIKQLCPPILLESTRSFRHALTGVDRAAGNEESQDLDVYWERQMAKMLESWGEGNAWTDIQLLMAHRRGKVLDIACGTGR